VLAGKASMGDLDRMTWGQVLKLNALMDMEEDMTAAHRAYLTKDQKE
jgi:hypothetical protein